MRLSYYKMMVHCTIPIDSYQSKIISIFHDAISFLNRYLQDKEIVLWLKSFPSWNVLLVFLSFLLGTYLQRERHLRMASATFFWGIENLTFCCQEIWLLVLSKDWWFPFPSWHSIHLAKIKKKRWNCWYLSNVWH